MGSDQASVALLESEEVCSLACLLKSEDLTANVLETCETLDEICSILLCYSIYHVGSNDSLDDCSVCWKAAILFLHLAYLILAE